MTTFGHPYRRIICSYRIKYVVLGGCFPKLTALYPFRETILHNHNVGIPFSERGRGPTTLVETSWNGASAIRWGVHFTGSLWLWISGTKCNFLRVLQLLETSLASNNYEPPEISFWQFSYNQLTWNRGFLSGPPISVLCPHKVFKALRFQFFLILRGPRNVGPFFYLSRSIREKFLDFVVPPAIFWCTCTSLTNGINWRQRIPREIVD